MVERLQGAMRQNKMRGLDDEATAQTMMDGLQIYYNFLRPHMTLEGKTPAQKAKIPSVPQTWQSLIKNATKSKREV